MATNSTECYNYVKEAVACAFEVTLQSGVRINYLNFCIIQSKRGIILDQTDHILDMLANYFPKAATTWKVDTPLRTDSQFETEISNNIPADPLELNTLEQ